MRKLLQMYITLMSELSIVCDIDIPPPTAPTIARAVVVPESPPQDRFILRQHLQDRFTTTETAHHTIGT